MIRRVLLLLVIALFPVIEDRLACAHEANFEPMKYLRETIGVVEARMQAWERAAAQQGIAMRRLISAPYGSGFLKSNPKAMDQDYLAVFDLGVLTSVSSQRQALELAGRLNQAMQIITRVNRALPKVPSLYIYDHGPVDRQGKLRFGANAITLIARQIEALKTGKPASLAFPDAKGRLVPSETYPRELVMPVNTRLKMATNTVNFYRDKFAGLRDISLELFFTAGLKVNGEIISVNVSPLYVKGARPIPLFEAVGRNFLTSKDAEIYRQRLMHLPMNKIVLYATLDLYAAGLREYKAANYLKQIKRLHATYDGLRSAFSISEQSEIESALNQWLHSDWALIAADIVEQADMWLKADKAMAAAFIEAGSLVALVEFLREALVKLEANYPQSRGELDEIRAVISDLECHRHSPLVFQRLKFTGGRISKAMQPDDQDMAQFLRLFSNKLKELGFHAIGLYKMRNQKVSLLKSEIAQAGFAAEKVNLPPEDGGLSTIGGYQYFVIDKLSPGEEPLKTVLFRSVLAGKAAENFARYEASLVDSSGEQ